MMIRDIIVKLIESDEDYNKGYDSAIERTYNKADLAQKQALDSVFVHLVGFPLSDIVNRSSGVLEAIDEVQDD
jgi:hypothetical protein